MEGNEIVYLNNGMNGDSDPSIQPNDTYYRGLNGNLISHGENKYSFESIKGTTLSFTLPNYFNFNLVTEALIPIGYISLGNDLVVYSANQLGSSQIGRVTFDDAGNGTYSVKYHNAALRFSLSHMIRGYGLLENDAYHRTYWSDDYNQPRSMNLASAVLNTYYDPFTTPLIHGEKYMVLNKVGTQGFYNGPTLYSIGTATNIFTFDSSLSISTFGTVNVDYVIIKYIDPSIFDYTPQKQQSTIEYYGTAKVPGQGSLKTGVNQYTYRLYTLDGYYSSWSPLSNFIHVTDKFYTNVGYQNYQGASNVNSLKSVTLRITDIPLIFDKIQIGVFESWSSVDGKPDNHTDANYIWYDAKITGSEMIVTHIGQENLSTLLLADVAFQDILVKRAKDIVSIKQRQILLNISRREEIFDYKPTATIAPMIYKVPSDMSGTSSSGYAFQHQFCDTNSVAPGDIYPDGIYVVRKRLASGADPVVVYNGVNYGEGETFIGTTNNTFTWSSNARLSACIRIQSHIKANGTIVYKIIDLHDEYYDYKSPATQMYLEGYWREETYRIAALFHDEFGIPFAVKYLDDITLPAQNTGYHLTNTYSSNTQLSLNILSLVISDLDITDIKDKVRGISIVRCLRDKTILAQGLITKIIEKDGESGTYVPRAFINNSSTADFNESSGRPTRSDIFGFMSPERDFDYGTLRSSGPLSEDKLKFISDLNRVNPTSLQSDGIATEQVYDKFTITANGSGVEKNILGIEYFDIGAQKSALFGTGITFKNYDIPAFVNWSTSPSLRCGTGGKKMLVLINGNYSTESCLANYVRPKTIDSLYGGKSDNAKANNVYVGTGHYLKIDDALLADILNPSTGRYVLNGMQVFGGDCFINLYDRLYVSRSTVYEDTPGASVYNYTAGIGLDPTHGSWSYAVIFPCESDINVALREGKHASRDGLGTAFDSDNINKREEFIYNEAYSSENIKVPYTPLPVDFRPVNRFPYMARWSELKVLGQKVDGMIKFSEFNFKNVDATHGELTCGLIGNDRLFYLQERGVGYFPIEERELSTSSLGAPIQLGVGGVMNRADNLDKFFGCQHKFSMYVGDDHFGFFDFRRKSYLMMSFNGQVGDVSVVLGMSAFFNNVFKVVETLPVNIYNTEDPINGYGIVGVFDARHRMGLMTFKFKDENKSYDFTIGVNAKEKCFIGFFSFTPSLYIEHNNQLISSGYVSAEPLKANTDYKVGDIVTSSLDKVKNFLYVCLHNYTTGNVPVDPNLDTVNWIIFSSKSAIYKYWDGDICKLFGVVYPFELQPVFKGAVTKDSDDTIAEKCFDYIQVYGNDTAFTDVYYEDSKRTAQDVDIVAKNKNFKYIDNAWWFNIALSKLKERMLDHYIKVKLVVKNYKTNPTISLNKVKRIVYLKIVYRKKL